MNKAQKIVISVYVAVCFLTFLAFLLWYFKFSQLYSQLLIDALFQAEYSGDYSRMDSLLIKMLLSDVLSWIILAIPTFFLYKYWADKKINT